jgi:translation initiation factor RLI1
MYVHMYLDSVSSQTIASTRKPIYVCREQRLVSGEVQKILRSEKVEHTMSNLTDWLR